MLIRFLAPILVLLPMTVAAKPPLPATVVVAFDRETITSLIVEGVADREAGRVVQANDPVRIASISKLIMALTTLRLVDEGKVDLKADISDYLGWPVRHPNYPEAKVTLGQLLAHRSALRDRAGYVIPLGESLQAKLSEPDAWYADAAPGEAPFEYANLGSPVIATVLEAATGERYDHLVERAVFAPLGIWACLNWIGCAEEQVAQAVILYRDTGEVARDDPSDVPPNCTIPVADGVECSLETYVPGTNASVFSPQGGVRIGMLDLAKIGQALMVGDERLIAPDQLTALKLSVRDAMDDLANTSQDFFCVYGIGAQVIQAQGAECQDSLFPDGNPRVGHAGEAYGLRAGLWFAPNEGSGKQLYGDTGLVYFTTAVPPRQSVDDEGGFDPREIALIQRAQELLAQQSED